MGRLVVGFLCLLVTRSLGRRSSFVSRTLPHRSVGASQSNAFATVGRSTHPRMSLWRGSADLSNAGIAREATQALIEIGDLPKNASQTHVQRLIAMLNEKTDAGNEKSARMLAKLEDLTHEFARLRISESDGPKYLPERVKDDLHKLHCELLAAFRTSCELSRREALVSLFGTSSLVASLLLPKPALASYALIKANSQKVNQKPTTRAEELRILASVEGSAAWYATHPELRPKNYRGPKYCAGNTASVSPMMENRCDIIGITKADQSNNKKADATGNYNIGSSINTASIPR